ncbi:hypothetical protein FTX61_02825 [Nitriliruptoraceae bacterium ZYF776]|nr:hypothetical protein [Profundirhabdus halotolerans]
MAIGALLEGSPAALMGPSGVVVVTIVWRYRCCRSEPGAWGGTVPVTRVGVRTRTWPLVRPSFRRGRRATLGS